MEEQAAAHGQAVVGLETEKAEQQTAHEAALAMHEVAAAAAQSAHDEVVSALQAQTSRERAAPTHVGEQRCGACVHPEMSSDAGLV